MDNNKRASGDVGQVTITIAVVVTVVAILAMGVAEVARVAVDRAEARSAADAVALASEDQVVRSFFNDRGIEIADLGGGGISTSSGDASAQAWASGSQIREAPALIAMVERAAQLAGYEFTPVDVQGDSIRFDAEQAAIFAVYAAEFGLCAAVVEPEGQQFDLC